MKANELKNLANASAKIEFQSLKAALNAVKQAADNDSEGVRAYLAEIGISMQALKGLQWQTLEPLCQKSKKSGKYCPWYVLGALRKYSDTEKAKADAKLEETKKVNAKAKKIRAKSDAKKSEAKAA